jgi:hypothetical protein
LQKHSKNVENFSLFPFTPLPPKPCPPFPSLLESISESPVFESLEVGTLEREKKV